MSYFEERLITRHMLDHIERFQQYIDDPDFLDRMPEKDRPLDAPELPFVSCPIYTKAKPTKVRFYKNQVWDLLFDPSCLDRNFVPVLDTKCNGYTVVKVGRRIFYYFYCSSYKRHHRKHEVPTRISSSGLSRKKRNTAKEDSDDSTSELCCEKLTHNFFLRFRGFLRVCYYGNHFWLLGIMINRNGKLQMFMKIEVEKDSPHFMLRFLDVEKRILVWGKDHSGLAKRSPSTKETVPEIILLEFPNEIVYKTVSAMLRPRCVSVYRDFISYIKQSPDKYTIAEEDPICVFGYPFNKCDPVKENEEAKRKRLEAANRCANFKLIFDVQTQLAGMVADRACEVIGEQSVAKTKLRVFLQLLERYSDADAIPETEWMKLLTQDEFYVTRQSGTEPAHSGHLTNNFKPGLYTCVCCGSDLFVSDFKYSCSHGWPSFSESVGQDLNVERRPDTSFGLNRTEVRCKCHAHLGHVFEDSLPKSGERYCINSRSIDFAESPIISQEKQM